MIQQTSNENKTCSQEDVSIDNVDILQTLRKRESLYILDYIPLNKKPRKSAVECRVDSPHSIAAIVSPADDSNKSVSPKTTSSTLTMRGNVCQWMYKVVDFCDYDRKVTFLA